MATVSLPWPTFVGESTLALAALLACLQIFGKWGRIAAWGQLFCILSAFLVLVIAHATADFRLANVFENVHTGEPLLYKIVGVWGNHEGSLLLWVLWLAIYNVLLRSQPIATHVMGFFMAGFVGLTLIACDPFRPLLVPLSEGLDLNPLLQDPSLIIHPPVLYAGLAGLSGPFALSIAALLRGHLDLEHLQNWVRWSWLCLTAGIALGSFWAYYELGWGGWWFWDPVENVALLPWLVATALIHSLRAYENNQALQLWGLFLGLLGFSLSLFGLFWVRSGLLTSVHSFAVDPERGSLLFSLAVLTSMAAFTLFSWRWRQLRTTNPTHPLARSGLIVLLSALLGTVALIVFVGVVYPILAQLWGQSLSIGAPYFNATVVPLALPLLVLMAFVPVFQWQVLPWRELWPQLLPLVLVMGFSWVLLMSFMHIAVLPIALTAVAFATAFSSLFWFLKTRQGAALAHLGFAIMVLGMIGATSGEIILQTTLSPSMRQSLGPYTVSFDHRETLVQPTYTAERAYINLYHQEQLLARLAPERRFYSANDGHHSETALISKNFSHVQASLGPPDAQGQWPVLFLYKPWINLLWGGIILTLIGGIGSFGIIRRLMSLLGVMCFIPIVAASDIEAKVYEIGQNLYCPICSGQTIAASESIQAQTLRNYIRQRLLQGAAPQVIAEELVQEYGEAILLSPQPQWLWVWPWLFLCTLFGMIVKLWRQRQDKGLQGNG